MKNYKAEIEKIRENHVCWVLGSNTNVLNAHEFEEAITSLFREIAKESLIKGDVCGGCAHDTMAELDKLIGYEM